MSAFATKTLAQSVLVLQERMRDLEVEVELRSGIDDALRARFKSLHQGLDEVAAIEDVGADAPPGSLGADAVVAVNRAQLGADVGRGLTTSEPLEGQLRVCAEAIVRRLGAAFVRIWTINTGSDVLQLRASAGLYTHLDGPHRSVQVGTFKIGLIAYERKPHLTNDVCHDPRVSDKEWAIREGMVAFAGYPLLVQDRLVGVVAMFARTALSSETLAALASVSDVIALGIERQRAESERNTLLKLEQAARHAAEIANRTKDEFLATVSHELRTPLNAMLGWTRLLRTADFPEPKRERALEAIERNAVAQTQLIDDLIDVARITSGNMRLDVHTVDLGRMIDGVVESFKPAIDAKELKFQAVLDPKAGPIIGDAARLQQVVWNLLSNAIKFTPKHGRIQISLERINSHIELTVTDSGLGISKEFLPYVFDRFKQADASFTRNHGGLGLGLAIARHIIELHGGTIAVASEGGGRGSSFSVTLALASVRHQARDASLVHPSIGDDPIFHAPPELVGLKVLVVDDEQDARDLVKAVLEQCGSIVACAATPSAALADIESERPDVLISDIGMPGEDGYSFIQRVRQLPADKGGTIPAAALTAYARAEDRRKALAAGFHMHVPKPVEPAELVAVVATLARIGRAMK